MKIYRNITSITQTVYDKYMNPIYVIPNGTVELEEEVAKKYEEILKPVIVEDKKPAKKE